MLRTDAGRGRGGKSGSLTGSRRTQAGGPSGAASRGRGGPAGVEQGGPRRGGPPRHVAAALGPLLDRLGLAPGLEDARIFTDWEASVGPEIGRVSRPHRLDGGVLVVHVRGSAWMSELSFRRDEILGRLNARRGRRKLTQLVFRIET